MYDWAEYRHFKYLLEILNLRGFRAAAEQLHTTQPNLSAHAKQFQENSAVHLYRKAKSGRISLTAAGNAFKLLAKGLLNHRDEAINALISIERGEIRTVRLGCSSQADPTIFHDFCALHKGLLPDCPVRPAHGDTAQLVEEIANGEIDAAIVTLPVADSSLHIEEIRRDRLVVCLRADDPLASKASIQPADLQERSMVLYHPQRNPQAHARLLELLAEVGVQVEEYSRASHPFEMQSLIKKGYGLALIREGTVLDSELTTRPVAGVDWTVDTAFVYRKERPLKTIPVLIRHLKSRLGRTAGNHKRHSHSSDKKPSQLSLLD